jgi:hypothetical protein
MMDTTGGGYYTLGTTVQYKGSISGPEYCQEKYILTVARYKKNLMYRKSNVTITKLSKK